MTLALLTFLALGGCRRGEPLPEPTGDTSDTQVPSDTGDTSAPGETGDTSGRDTSGAGDTSGTVETADTGPAPPECGNSVLESGESCDDGNVVATDGCGVTCAVEAGWDCGSAEPSVCVPVCGDGLIRGVEVCDDGGTALNDGCDGSCKPEAEWSCDGNEPSVCTVPFDFQATCEITAGPPGELHLTVDGQAVCSVVGGSGVPTTGSATGTCRAGQSLAIAASNDAGAARVYVGVASHLSCPDPVPGFLQGTFGGAAGFAGVASVACTCQ